jgi:tetratricopeptide (TPR) repeat protein
VFRRLIGRSVALVAAEATQPDWRPSPDQQARLLFALANALRLPAAWGQTLPLLAALAPRMEQAGLREDWLAYLQRGITCCDISGDAPTAAQLALECGILLERLGRLAEAQAGLEDAIVRFAAAGDRRGQAKAHNRLAYVLLGRRAAAEAAHHIDQAQALLEPADSELHYCRLVAGLLAFDARDWPAAEQHLQYCVQGWRASGERRLYGMSLINLAATYIATSRYDEAAELLGAAVDVLAAVEDTANLALVHLNLGVIHLILHRCAEAAAELLMAEAVYRQLQDQQRLALVYSNLGLAYAELGRPQEAEQHFEAAIHRFAMLEDHPNLVDTLIDFARLHLQCGQPALAEERARQAQALLTHIAQDRVRDYQQAKIDDLLAAAGKRFGGNGHP